jgi:hypothetical protein
MWKKGTNMDALVLLEDLSVSPRRLGLPSEVLVVEAEGRCRRRSGADILRLSDVVPYQRLLGLNLKAKEAAARWYRVAGVDLTLWESTGVSVGECLRQTAGIMLSRALRHATLYQELMEHYHCDQVFLWGELPPWSYKYTRSWNLPTKSLVRRSRLAPLRAKLFRKAINGRARLLRLLRQERTSNMTETPAKPADSKLRIFAPPDAVLNGFIEQLADHLEATVYASDPSAGRRNLGFSREDVEAEYRRRADQIVDSREFQDMCEQIGSWCLPMFSEWVRSYLPRTAAYTVIAGMDFKEFLREEHIDLLISAMPWMGLRRAYVQVAQRCGIPSIALQDGVLGEHETMSLPPIDADYALTLGAHGSGWFEQAGFASQNICRAGDLLWGDKTKVLPPDHVPCLKSTVEVLYLAPRPEDHSAQFSLSEADEEMELVCSTLAQRPFLHVSVRFHPRWKDYLPFDWRWKKERMMSGLLRDRVTFLQANESVETAIERADVVVCYASSALVQAVRLRKPVVYVDVAAHQHPYSKVMKPISRPAELLAGVDQAVRCGSEVVRRWREVLGEQVDVNVNWPDVVDFVRQACIGPGTTVRHESLGP